MRPVNETEADLRREALVVAEFCRALGYDRWVKLGGIHYRGVDYAAFNMEGTLVAWIEAKARTKAYDPILLGASKAMHLYRWQAAFHVPAWFVIHTPTHGVQAHRIAKPSDYAVRIGGSNRGQDGDIEPCVYIPLAAFSTIAPPLELSP